MRACSIAGVLSGVFLLLVFAPSAGAQADSTQTASQAEPTPTPTSVPSPLPSPAAEPAADDQAKLEKEPEDRVETVPEAGLELVRRSDQGALGLESGAEAESELVVEERVPRDAEQALREAIPLFIDRLVVDVQGVPVPDAVR